MIPGNAKKAVPGAYMAPKCPWTAAFVAAYVPTGLPGSPSNGRCWTVGPQRKK